MGLEALKLELIEWLSKLEDRSTVEYLKIVKDSADQSNDWWNDLSETEKAGIEGAERCGRRTGPFSHCSEAKIWPLIFRLFGQTRLFQISKTSLIIWEKDGLKGKSIGSKNYSQDN